MATFKYYDGTKYNRITGGLVPKTTKTTSDTETYSCNYINGIVESGSNENGNWIKYNDGTMICTSVKVVESICNKAWGNLYETSWLQLGKMPQTFISTPYNVSATLTSASGGKAGFIEFIDKTTETSWGQTIVARAVSSDTSLIFAINLIAIGKWK